jgi:ABC-type Fe3+ transport system substrate-binding protein
VNGQIFKADQAMKRKDLTDVTTTTQANTEISEQLKTLMANDLQWSTLLNRLRSTGATSDVTIARITAALSDPKNAGTPALPSTSTATTVATLTIEGAAADKKTIAGFIDNLGKTTGIANPFLTAAAQSQVAGGTASNFTFTANADVTAVTLCGRFTKPCPTGGK